MARTWALLGRVLRVPVPVVLAPGVAPAAGGEGEAEAERDAQAHGVAEAVAAAGAQAGGGVGEAAAAAQPGADFSIPLAEPPRITVMTAAPSAQPFVQYPDSHPYILCVGGSSILLNFGVAPFKGACFDDRPYRSNLIVVRDYNWAGVAQGRPITAIAEHIPPRDDRHAIVCNVESIGLISGFAHAAYFIAELMISKGNGRATLLYYYEGREGLQSKWIEEHADNPLPWRQQPDREWVPSGVISYNDKKTLWWFDLSWGIIIYDPRCQTAEPLLRFHGLPEGQDLNAAQRMHGRRCITVSRGVPRYVAITPDAADADAATVSMWTWKPTVSGWEQKFTVSFAEIWNHASYTNTGLPRKVPVLVAVSPTNANMVYFALEDPKRLFGVNMYSRAVEEFIDESYELLTPGPEPEEPPSCRYVLPWDLPLEVAQALGLNPLAPDPEDEQLSDQEDEEEEQEPEDDEEEQSEPEVDYEAGDPMEEALAGFVPVVEDEEVPDIEDSELPVDESMDMDEVVEPLSMNIDPATIARMRSEIKEDRLKHELAEERLRQSRNPGPGDDAGEGASS